MEICYTRIALFLYVSSLKRNQLNGNGTGKPSARQGHLGVSSLKRNQLNGNCYARRKDEPGLVLYVSSLKRNQLNGNRFTSANRSSKSSLFTEEKPIEWKFEAEDVDPAGELLSLH